MDTEIILSYSPGIIGRIISDAIAVGVAYTLSFVGCDLIYNDFSLSQSIKSSYWFFLGPFLWRWGTAIPWVFEILKNFVEGKWSSIKDSFVHWVEGSLPSWVPTFIVEPTASLAAELIDADGEQMIDNYNYIQKQRFQE